MTLAEGVWVPLVTGDRLSVLLRAEEPTPEMTAAAAAADHVMATQVLTPGDHTTHPACVEAAGAVAVQVWQARQAPGGQLVGIDGMPGIAPHLLGPGLVARVQGLVPPACNAHSLGGWPV